RLLLADLVPALGKEDLSHPETSRGTVEQPEQLEMVLLAGSCWELDERSRAIEHLAAVVEHEVVVRRHEGEDQGKRRAEFGVRQPAELIPLKPILNLRLAPEHLVVRQATPV